jgi:hypothetical protein
MVVLKAAWVLHRGIPSMAAVPMFFSALRMEYDSYPETEWRR